MDNTVHATTDTTTAMGSEQPSKATRAKEYLRRLHSALTGPEYKQFLGIMSRFKKRQLTKRKLISEIDDLLSANSNGAALLSGFEVFLPAGVTVEMVREGASKGSTHSEVYTQYAGSVFEEPLDAHSESVQEVPTIEIRTSGIVAHAAEGSSSMQMATELPSAMASSSRNKMAFDVHNQKAPLASSTFIPKKDPDAMASFSVKVQHEFRNSPEKHEKFVSLISESRSSPSSYPGAIFQATQLLRSAPYLLAEFKDILAIASFGGISLSTPMKTVSDDVSGFANAPRRFSCGSQIDSASNGIAGSGRHRKSRSMSSWTAYAEALRDVGASAQVSAGPTGAGRIEIVCGGANESTGLLMTYEQWVQEHARRSGLSATSSLVPTTGGRGRWWWWWWWMATAVRAIGVGVGVGVGLGLLLVWSRQDAAM
ncbi:hypothetical protein HDU83_009493 [Entophlyctis luteolus]|nr:hypothetical protein HDU83_009493 [Entophlyctis luteolus]KAJ3388201.1 hypothetical protein HDU84_000200 [Entophlyctis sp. JEL0112]